MTHQEFVETINIASKAFVEEWKKNNGDIYESLPDFQDACLEVYNFLNSDAREIMKIIMTEVIMDRL